MNSAETLLNLAGGVALLLWATRTVRTGIERAYGAGLRRTMAKALSGRLRAAMGGLFVSLALQSAAGTALLAMSFVASGAMLTAPGLAVMLGADLGSAIAALVLSLDLSWLSPLVLLVGVVMFMTSTDRTYRQIGRTLVGIGLILLALTLIRTTSADIAGSETVSNAIGLLHEEPLIVFLLAAVLTWVAHSSVAIILVIASLMASGVLTLPIALTCVLGANFGAGLIPLFMSMHRPRDQQRIPFGNLVFRAIGSIALLSAVPSVSNLMGTLALAPVYSVVVFHLAFNLLLLLFFLPFVAPIARLSERVLVERVDESLGPSPLDNPSHLDPKVISQPQIALAAAMREVLRMADWVEMMLREALEVFQGDNKFAIKRLASMDDQIDAMHNAIKHYLVQVSRNQLDDDQSRRCMELASFTMKLEHIGDIIEKNLLQLARKHVEAARRFSDEGWVELTELHARVVANMQLSLNVFVSGDVDTARQLIEEKQRFRVMQLKSNRRHMARLRAGATESIDSSPIHLDVIRDLSQINSLLCSVSYPILEQSGDLLDSRLREIADDDDEPLADEPEIDSGSASSRLRPT